MLACVCVRVCILCVIALLECLRMFVTVYAFVCVRLFVYVCVCLSVVVFV